ncbi:hypothetical protein QBC36DRAFT_339478 [Triangularia setosa]|uniref:Uncharacterized protein n=1 Tax=Triangularia setosa TaxID=2587417 RepID=A0AAN7A3C3_9PEZI|nr:hypothetical protein QBC36DRAFT_339478 [Podospora setosa]
MAFTAFKTSQHFLISTLVFLHLQYIGLALYHRRHTLNAPHSSREPIAKGTPRVLPQNKMGVAAKEGDRSRVETARCFEADDRVGESLPRPGSEEA